MPSSAEPAAGPAVRAITSRSWRGAPRLDVAFDPSDNALNLIRLVLAVSVIVGHAAELGGYELPGPLVVVDGEVAVDAFFGISGFLIARSWLRRPGWARYLWHRGLRILPAFWVCLVVTAVVLAPLGIRLGGDGLDGFWSAPDSPLAYVRSNALLWIGQKSIAGSPAGVAHPEAWNGSLWTLYWEVLCYLGLGILGVLGLLRARRRAVLGLFLAVWSVVLVRAASASIDERLFDTQRAQSVVRLSLLFLGGVVLHLYAERVPVHRDLALLAVGLVVAGEVLSTHRLLGGLALTYLALYLSTVLRSRVGSRHDLSYGMYIYAFPCQQVLALGGLSDVGWLPYAVLGTVATVPLAAGSWFLVERPALGLKDWTPPWADRATVTGRSSPRRPELAGLAVLVALLALELALMVDGWLVGAG